MCSCVHSALGTLEKGLLSPFGTGWWKPRLSPHGKQASVDSQVYQGFKVSVGQTDVVVMPVIIALGKLKPKSRVRRQCVLQSSKDPVSKTKLNKQISPFQNPHFREAKAGPHPGMVSGLSAWM